MEQQKWEEKSLLEYDCASYVKYKRCKTDSSRPLQGVQAELRLQIQQRANPNFAFLRASDRCHAYFRWAVDAAPRYPDGTEASPCAAPPPHAHARATSTTGGAVEDDEAAETHPKAKDEDKDSAPHPPALVAYTDSSSSEEDSPSSDPVNDEGGNEDVHVSPVQMAPTPSPVITEVDKLLAYLSRAGASMAAAVREAEGASATYGFLLPGTEHFAYFEARARASLPDDILAAILLPPAPAADTCAGPKEEGELQQHAQEPRPRSPCEASKTIAETPPEPQRPVRVPPPNPTHPVATHEAVDEVQQRRLQKARALTRSKFAERMRLEHTQRASLIAGLRRAFDEDGDEPGSEDAGTGRAGIPGGASPNGTLDASLPGLLQVAKPKHCHAAQSTSALIQQQLSKESAAAILSFRAAFRDEEAQESDGHGEAAGTGTGKDFAFELEAAPDDAAGPRPVWSPRPPAAKRARFGC